MAAPSACPAFTPQNGSNALAYVAGLVAAATPRDAGTPGAERAADWIAGQLREMPGLRTRRLSFDENTSDGLKHFHNVVAEYPGTENRWIVLLSHFDTKRGIGGGFEGANDGGSSTGILLELAKTVAAAGPRRQGILFAWVDGEECAYEYGQKDGLHGSRRLAVHLRRENRRIDAVVVLDMIGDRDLQLGIPANTTPRLRDLARQAAHNAGLADKIVLYPHAILDDHQPFLDLGYPAIDIIDFSYGPRNSYWHTPADTLDKLSAESLTATGQFVCALLALLVPT